MGGLRRSGKVLARLYNFAAWTAPSPCHKPYIAFLECRFYCILNVSQYEQIDESENIVSLLSATRVQLVFNGCIPAVQLNSWRACDALEAPIPTHFG